jgi:hypothetical protein
MNDLEILHETWEAPPASPEARAAARAALLERAATTRAPRRRRLVPRLAMAAVAVLIVVAGVAVVDDLGRGPDGLSPVPIASAAVLERAADAAERRPFTAPRDDQWIYIEDRLTSSQGGEPMTRETWRRADGAGMAWIDDAGRLRVEITRPSKRRPLRIAVGPLAGYRTLAALPTDADALLAWAYRQAKNVTGAGITEHGDVYAIFSGMLRDNLLPPDLEAAIYRALIQVPNVTVEATNVAGRPALVLGQTEDWLREELLLDARTYRYLGQSGIVVRDATIDPAKAGNRTGEIEKGQTAVAERISTAVVDRPGQRP